MSKEVSLKKHPKIIPTYIPKKAHELPMFFENKPYQGASGKIYPVRIQMVLPMKKRM